MNTNTILEEFRSLPQETQVFIGFILFAAVLLHIRFNARAVSNGPTILTTVGIFATFFGIALGLSRFNTADVQGSIPQLLAGLKTAFWASVVGVGCALTIKFRDHLFGHAHDPLALPGHDDVGAAEIVQGVGRVEHALVGDEEGSLLSQIKFLRTETRDELRQLRDAQTKALEKLSEMGSKTLIEALKDVIRDFNDKLTEQFGENFKQLNLAVGKLVEWQEQYRSHVETTTTQLSEIHQLLSKITEHYAQVVVNSSEFSKHATALGLTLTELSARQDELRKQGEALALLLLQASGSLPEIEKKIVDLARQLANGLTQSKSIVEAALLTQTKSMGEVVDKTTAALSKSMADGAQTLRQSMDNTIQAMSAANSENNKQISELTSKTKENVALLDKALSEELEKSLTSLGRQLTALSKQFVDDYLPLTNSLRQVVELARRAGMQ